jgi:hypothetical protein
MDPVLFLRPAAYFQPMELERVKVIFCLETSSRARFRFTGGNRGVEWKLTPFGLTACGENKVRIRAQGSYQGIALAMP